MVQKNAKRNQNLMHLIKRVHGIVENTDLEKHRQSQDTLGTILGNTKEITYTDVTVDEIHGEWICVNKPHLKQYIIMHCHGGGYSTGSSIYARTLTSKLATATAMDVFCFDYRLAPENPYPAATQDAMKMWNYLLQQGFGADHIILTGDSAGGNLALTLVLQLLQENRKLPAGVILLSPWTDLTSSGESFIKKAGVDPVLSKDYIDRMVEAYAPGEDLNNPYISPLFGSYKGMTSIYIQVGRNEILLSDSKRLEQKLKDEGVDVKLDIFTGMWHVFQMSPVKAAKEAIDRCAEFIYRTFGL